MCSKVYHASLQYFLLFSIINSLKPQIIAFSMSGPRCYALHRILVWVSKWTSCRKPPPVSSCFISLLMQPIHQRKKCLAQNSLSLFNLYSYHTDSKMAESPSLRKWSTSPDSEQLIITSATQQHTTHGSPSQAFSCRASRPLIIMSVEKACNLITTR